MLPTLLAQATWEEVVPFIAMATVPLGTAIAVLWKRNNQLQDKMLETAEKVLPLATQLDATIVDILGLVEQIQRRTPSKSQMDRFSRNMERLDRKGRER